MKFLSIALALLGLAAATALIGWYGFAEVAAATFAAGWPGFFLLCLWQGLLFVILAAAWAVIAPARGGGQGGGQGAGQRGGQGAAQHGAHRFAIYLWGRAVRDSAGSCLPFTHMGGFVAGARAVSLQGIPPTQATASTVADVTAEVLAQIIFAAIGLVILVAIVPHSSFAWPVAIGLALALPAVAGFVAAQHGAAKLFARLSRHIIGEWFANTQERARILTAEFILIYGHTTRLVVCVAVHLLAWIGSGIGGWMAFRLLGAEITLMEAIAIESLLYAMLAIAFLVPGYIGVQEAAYIGLGAAFGVAPEIALAASLLRRGRDLALGIPILLSWQWLEWRRLRHR